MMAGLRPLYGQERQKKDNKEKTIPKQSHPEMHLGLWYDKFCNQWVKRDNFWVLGKSKKAWIEDVSKRVGDHKRIEAAVTRLQTLVEARAGSLLHMKTAGRFVTGLGRSHPIENGFAWHPTLGTPYLPGSSIKGMVRAWAREAGEAEKTICRLLGPGQPDKKEAVVERKVGEWIFFDALPLAMVQLETDIMTPHYSEYYSNPKKPPHDRNNPNPIPFLTVAQGQPFLFGIAPRQSKDGDHEQDRKRLLRWIREALEWIGAGAKTAVGYGRFEVERELEKV